MKCSWCDCFDTIPRRRRSVESASISVRDTQVHPSDKLGTSFLERNAMGERPTHVRFGVLAFLCSLSFVLYVDRVCLGQAIVPIQNELKLKDGQMGVIAGAFTLAYCIFEVPTGWLGDRYGSRGVLTRIVVWWSAFTALTGAATNFYMLLGVRFLFGAGEAGAFPNAARVSSRWFAAEWRSRAQGMIVTCSQLGGAVAPVVADYCIRWVGWRLAFVFFGGMGMVWAAAFYWWFRDNPADHPGTNSAERDLIGAGSGSTARPDSPIPWACVLRSTNVWLLGAVMSASASAYYMYMTWCPKYLQAARDVTPQLAGRLSSLVLFGGAIGALSGGFIADAAVKLTGELRWSRRIVGVFALAVGAVMLRLSVECDDARWAALCMALACLAVQTQIATWWATVTGISGQYIAAMFGLMNSMGFPGAFGSQVFLGRFLDNQGARGLAGRAAWDPAFDVYTVVLLIGAGCWFVVDPRRSAVGELSEHAGVLPERTS